ncbi:ammonium transporter AmtB-like domain containing protein [Nitzschia inconspicua]|uniref:Ammonium transporter n=1 Tax=Nitzschia inconspicua TaxID=303405 RepID=A0A9K3KLR5_9STRA|nr:ammonium transporter AmtB-like domain containing protein [Nitzschia inconspicua]
MLSSISSIPGNVFLDCAAQNPDAGANSTLILRCISDTYQNAEENSAANVHSFLLVVCGALIFFMQAGFAMLCAGSVRLKNVQNTMLKNLLDACGAALAFFLLGYGIAFGGNDDEGAADQKTFIGTSDYASVGTSSAFWFYQYTFSATSVTIVAGTLAERCQMAAYLCYSAVVAGFIYPVVAHALWSHSGFLSHSNNNPFLNSGVIDFAGGAVVHLTGGLVALIATCILGPRRGRFYDAQGEPLESPKEFPGHSVALQLLGTMVLWFGWYGFSPGSALLLGPNSNFGIVAANAAVSTALSGAAGGVTALFSNMWIEERRSGEPHFSIGMAMNGALSGLVASTSGCAVLEPGLAIVTGLIAGWLYMWSSSFLLRIRIDDAVNAIPVHMFNGAWGLLATGLFASPEKMEVTFGNSNHPGLFYSFRNGGVDAALFANQLVGLLFVTGWCLFTMLPFFIWLNYMGWLRADSLEELVGLDLSYHGSSGAGNMGAVKKEYVDAYNRHKSALRRRKTPNLSSSDDLEGSDAATMATGPKS